MKPAKSYPVSCNRDCITGCPLEAVVEDGVLTKIRNSPHRFEYMNGCVRGFRFPSVVYHPDRLTRPMIAVTGRAGVSFARPAGMRPSIWWLRSCGAAMSSRVRRR